MPPLFQELDYRPTDLGTLILRRRWEPRLEAFIHEIKLGGDFVMTSAVTASEVALAERGLAALVRRRPAGKRGCRDKSVAAETKLYAARCVLSVSWPTLAGGFTCLRGFECAFL